MAGLSEREIERRLEAGWLVLVHRGVYAVGHIALTDKSHLIAAVYACGEEALASHRAAGKLWGILRGGQPVEVTGPRSRELGKGFVLHRSRLIHGQDRALIDISPSPASPAPSSTSPTSSRKSGSRTRSRGRGQAPLRPQKGRVRPRPPTRTKGRHKLMRVLSAYRDVQPFTRSRGERFVLGMCEAHGLPKPHVNTWVDSEEVDFYWPEAKLVLEFDGEAVHRTTRAFHQDRGRDRSLAAKGTHLVRATERDEAAILARELEQILAVRRRR
jgi:hypothetical protein